MSIQPQRPPASELKDELLDNSLADSFPSSDPPSTVHPTPDDSEHMQRLQQYGLPPGTWAAVSIDEQRVVGTGRTREEAEENARQGGHLKLWLVHVDDAALQVPEAA